MSCSYLRLNLNKTLPPLQGGCYCCAEIKILFWSSHPFFLLFSCTQTLKACSQILQPQSKPIRGPPLYGHQYFMPGASHKIPKLTPRLLFLYFAESSLFNLFGWFTVRAHTSKRLIFHKDMFSDKGLTQHVRLLLLSSEMHRCKTALLCDWKINKWMT